jgi:hypothetical protein
MQEPKGGMRAECSYAQRATCTSACRHTHTTRAAQATTLRAGYTCHAGANYLRQCLQASTVLKRVNVGCRVVAAARAAGCMQALAQNCCCYKLLQSTAPSHSLWRAPHLDM